MTRVLYLVLMVACDSGAKPAVTTKAISQAEIDAVNGLVPEKRSYHFEFVVRTIADQGRTYRFLAPKEWRTGRQPLSLEAELEYVDDGMQAMMHVERSCGGACTAQDWAATTNKLYFAQLTNGTTPGKVIKDDLQPNRRTLVFQSDDGGVRVTRVWWEPGATSFMWCEVVLGKHDAALASAFEKACETVSVAE